MSHFKDNWFVYLFLILGLFFATLSVIQITYIDPFGNEVVIDFFWAEYGFFTLILFGVFFNFKKNHKMEKEFIKQCHKVEKEISYLKGKVKK